MTVWQNGAFLPEEEVRLSPFDSGLTVGKGVFETLIALRGEPFAWTRHYERLISAAEIFDLEIPSSEIFREGIISLLTHNEFQTARIRLTVTGGVGGPGVTRKGPPTTFITTTPFVDFPLEAVVCSAAARDFSGPLDGQKSLSYAENILAMEGAKNRGFDEVLLPNRNGNLCEASGSNVFVVSKGEVLTP
ncbi:aminotransferase class IV, partial [Akkermansiaceae bacterium]|nr:aminotransferase class IV [Akkermansiaceae bacterium]